MATGDNIDTERSIASKCGIISPTQRIAPYCKHISSHQRESIRYATVTQLSAPDAIRPAENTVVGIESMQKFLVLDRNAFNAAISTSATSCARRSSIESGGVYECSRALNRRTSTFS